MILKSDFVVGQVWGKPRVDEFYLLDQVRESHGHQRHDRSNSRPISQVSQLHRQTY
ncbi:hypothetical protein [Nostoc sp. C057]|uniref:hypothetical protein n=1 Tax=Nostoc sp. C057 TaxID=2576903 RepID=UPI0015C40790|nr:hypothetical protein [Nostoc sp. C057]